MTTPAPVFLNALMFFTRLPVPADLPYSEAIMRRTSRYLPLIGWIVGAIGAAVFYALHFVLSPGLAIVLSMVATVLATGAFHEDGFADFCDAFGGGNTRAQILAIMKDSRIGTYGGIGLLGMLATKFMALDSIAAMESSQLPMLLVAGHALSRLIPLLIINSATYAREEANSKSRPMAHQGRVPDLIFALLCGLALLVFMPISFSLIIIAALLLVTLTFRNYISRKIGGYTGDCLGAIQQLAEVVFYLGFVIYLNLH